MMRHTRITCPRKSSIGCSFATAAILLLAGCAASGSSGFLGDAKEKSSGGGSTAAMLGDTALGGITGSSLVDHPDNLSERDAAKASRNSDDTRRRDYERQSGIQQEKVRKEIEEQRLFEQWKRTRLSQRE